jgi:hypothetical protein
MAVSIIGQGRMSRADAAYGSKVRSARPHMNCSGPGDEMTQKSADENFKT